MRSPNGVIAWAKQNPTNPGSGGPNWNNDCVQFVWYSGSFPPGNSAATANLARASTLAHGHQMILDYSPPKGYFVYFDGPTTAGHLGMSVGGGKFLSATVYERDPDYGTNLGEMLISDYAKIPGVSYKGASPFFINMTLDLSTTAGDIGTAIIGANEMRTIRHPNGVISAVGEMTYQHLTPTTVLGEPPYEQLTAVQYDNAIVNTQIRKAQFNAAPGGTVDEAAIAIAVQAILADEFASIANQVTAVNAALEDSDIVDESEMTSLLTSTANIINAHTTAAKEEVLAAIDGISAGASPANFSIELTGTAAPSA